jgi:hypothetical protein
MLLFLAVAASLVSNWGTPADFFKQFLLNAMLLGIIVNGIRRVSRFSLLGRLLVIASVDLATGALELLSQPDSFYHTQGYLVVATLALLLGLPLMAWRLSPGEKLSPA